MSRNRIRPEIFILVLLIVCVTFIINFEQYNGHQKSAVMLNPDGRVIIMHDQKEIYSYRSSGHTLLEFNLDACQLLEVYDEKMENIFSVVYVTDECILGYDICNQPLKDIYLSDKSGSIDVIINNQSYVVDFYWDLVGESKYLVVYMRTRSNVYHILIFNIVCYLTLILCFIMFSMSIYWHNKNAGRRYKQIHDRINSRLL